MIMRMRRWKYADADENEKHKKYTLKYVYTPSYVYEYRCTHMHVYDLTRMHVHEIIHINMYPQEINHIMLIFVFEKNRNYFLSKGVLPCM